MSQQNPITLIIDTKDGAAFKGTYVSKDTQKLIITLSNVTKSFQGKEEIIPYCEISKENIAKISMIDNRPIKEEIQNVNEIPEDKKNEYNENKLDNVDKAYDKKKDDFFDDLKLTTKDDMKNMAKNYNLKNMDTFKLEKNSENDEDYNKKRGFRGGRRGRGRGGERGFGRGNRGGYRGNYGNNNYNKSQQQKNKFNNYGYGNNGGNMNHQGYNNNNNYRGRGGNFKNNRHFNRGGYNNKNNFESSQNNSNQVKNDNNNNHE